MLSGSLRIFYLFDISEEIRLEELRKILGAEPPIREPRFRHPAPEYVRFAKPPVVETLEPILTASGERLPGQIHYFDYGVVSVQLELRFTAGWPELVTLAARWIDAPELEQQVAARVRQHLAGTTAALVKPYDTHLVEDYYVVQLDPLTDSGGNTVSAARLIEQHGGAIAQIVRGELAALSSEEEAEILSSRMSYYPTDLVVVGWTAAFIYDTPEGAASTIRLLEYANTQLLEFRHYDDLLTERLGDVYRLLDRGTGPLRRWRLAREAEKLNTIRLDVTELAERADTAIKFLSDMFSARVYRLAEAKVGVPDYRRLVDEKLAVARDLYQFMNDRFHQSSALILEAMVVIILIIDLVYLFGGGRH
jgi:hypothetical protein